MRWLRSLWSSRTSSWTTSWTLARFRSSSFWSVRAIHSFNHEYTPPRDKSSTTTSPKTPHFPHVSCWSLYTMTCPEGCPKECAWWHRLVVSPVGRCWPKTRSFSFGCTTGSSTLRRWQYVSYLNPWVDKRSSCGPGSSGTVSSGSLSSWPWPSALWTISSHKSPLSTPSRPHHHRRSRPRSHCQTPRGFTPPRSLCSTFSQCWFPSPHTQIRSRLSLSSPKNGARSGPRSSCPRLSLAPIFWGLT